jgi:predicted enzyme involved in methoxymalonyl-ACP biosynthesis
MQSVEPEKIVLPKNTALDRDKWRALVEGWDSSTENQKNYCKRLGISLNTFTYVRGKLLPKENVNSKFIPVVISPPEKSIKQKEHCLTLESKRGLMLHISPTLSVEQLSKILTLCGWQHD